LDQGLLDGVELVFANTEIDYHLIFNKGFKIKRESRRQEGEDTHEPEEKACEET